MPIEALYAQPILQLAREAHHVAPVQRPTAGATVLSNRFCGDEVRLDVRLEEGLIREIACSVHGCVLCEVSAVIMRQAMIGKDDSSLPQAEQFLSNLAGGSPVTPPAGWEELGTAAVQKPRGLRSIAAAGAAAGAVGSYADIG